MANQPMIYMIIKKVRKFYNEIPRYPWLVILKLERFYFDLAWTISWALLNRREEIYVSKCVFLDKTAKLQLKPSRILYGGKIHISANSKIMEGVLLSPYGGSIYIDENVFIGPYCVLYGHGGLAIGRDTMIAAHTVIIPSNHGFSDPDRKISSQPLTKFGITIGEDVWIGCGVRILDGVSIGRGCVIGAGAVVTKSLPNYSIAVGVPARVIGSRGCLHRQIKLEE
jgi:acetyltransferase-like isoleucine patch superfamily enzyme